MEVEAEAVAAAGAVAPGAVVEGIAAGGVGQMEKKSIGLNFGVLVALIAAMLLPLTAAADDVSDGLPIVQPAKVYYVRDDANVLSDQTESHIVQYGEELYEQTGSQMVVVTMDFTGSIPVADYAHQILEQWGVSGGNDGNGIVLLMSIGNREYHLLSGKGLNKYLSAGTLGELAERYMEPNFSQGQYDQGARELFDALKERVALVYADEDGAPPTVDPTQRPTAESAQIPHGSGAARDAEESVGKARMNPGLGAIVVVLGVILLVRYRRNGKEKRKK